MNSENIYNLKDYTLKYNNNTKQIFSYKSKLQSQKYIKLPLYNSRSLDKISLSILKKSVKYNNEETSIFNVKRLSQEKYQSSVKSGPFDKSKLTNFGNQYLSGTIPVKLIHGNVKLKLQWTKDPIDCQYDPLIINCFEGLLELKHPYSFLAKQCCFELLQAPNAKNKILPILSVCISNLRNALISEKETVFSVAVSILKLLTDIMKENIIPYIKLLIQPLNKLSLKIKYKDQIQEIFRDFESIGGKEAFIVIKNKVPSYVGFVN